MYVLPWYYVCTCISMSELLLNRENKSALRATFKTTVK